MFLLLAIEALFHSLVDAFNVWPKDHVLANQKILEALGRLPRFAVGEFDGRFQGELPPSGLMLP